MSWILAKEAVEKFIILEILFKGLGQVRSFKLNKRKVTYLKDFVETKRKISITLKFHLNRNLEFIDLSLLTHFFEEMVSNCQITIMFGSLRIKPEIEQ